MRAAEVGGRGRMRGMHADARETKAQPTAGRTWLLCAGALLFLCLRTPYELVHGMVYDEEGTVYLRYAWDATVRHALLAPHQGYYSLFANGCGVVAARVVPLEQAGHFLFGAEIAVQLLMVWMVVECERFAGVWQKLLAVAVALLTPPTSAIVLSTIHGQFFLAVMTAAILISDAERLRWARLAALGLAGLTGVTSCLLLPLFVWQAWRERARDRPQRMDARKAQVAVLGVCAVVQALVILTQPRDFHGTHSTLRFYAGALLSNGVMDHFFTSWSYVEVCKAVGSPKLRNLQELFWLAVEGASALYLAVTAWLAWRSGRAARLMAAAALLSLAASFSRSLVVNMDLMCGSGGRYFVIFNILTGLSLVLVSQNTRGLSALAARVLLACCLWSGARELEYIAIHPHLPVWSQQVAAWRADPARGIAVRPGYWPDVKLTREPGNQDLPANIYDTNQPGWRDR